MNSDSKFELSGLLGRTVHCLDLTGRIVGAYLSPQGEGYCDIPMLIIDTPDHQLRDIALRGTTLVPDADAPIERLIGDIKGSLDRAAALAADLVQRADAIAGEATANAEKGVKDAIEHLHDTVKTIGAL